MDINPQAVIAKLADKVAQQAIQLAIQETVIEDLRAQLARQAEPKE